MSIKKIQVSSKMKNNLFMVIFCVIVTLIFAIPMLNATTNKGADVLFHVNRIDSLVYAMEHGDNFPRVLFNQNFGFGYGSPLFYSIFFLYIPAYLQMNFNVLPMESYRMLLVLIVFVASLSIYYCCRVVVSQKRTPSIMLVTLLYVCNPQFLSNIYKRGALGEGLAYAFIPIVLLGIYQVLCGNKKHWWVLVIGFSGLLLSHNISFILMCIVFGIMIIFRIKFLLKEKDRIIYIAIAALWTFLLTAFFSLPMLEQLNTGYYRISNYFADNTLAGLELADYFNFSLSPNVFNNSAIGIVLLFVPILVFFTPRSAEKKFPLICGVIGYFCLFATTKYFPWEWFPFMTFLQFPTRLLTIACSFLAIAAAYGLNNNYLKNNVKTVVILACLAESLIASVYYTIQLANNTGEILIDYPADVLASNDYFYSDYDIWYSIVELSSPDYLVIDSDIHYYDEYNSELGGRRITSNIDEDCYEFDESSYNSLVFSKNTIQEGSIYALPREYYKGYVIEAFLANEDGSEEYIGDLTTSIDENTGNVQFMPDKFEGPGVMKFNLVYKGTSTQRNSMTLSIITMYATIFMIIIYWIYLLLLKFHVLKQGMVSNFVSSIKH